jgi:hypothetical protein
MLPADFLLPGFCIAPAAELPAVIEQEIAAGGTLCDGQRGEIRVSGMEPDHCAQIQIGENVDVNCHEIFTAQQRRCLH